MEDLKTLITGLKGKLSPSEILNNMLQLTQAEILDDVSNKIGELDYRFANLRGDLVKVVDKKLAYFDDDMKKQTKLLEAMLEEIKILNLSLDKQGVMGGTRFPRDKVHQYDEVAAGESGVIFRLKMPDGFIGHIDMLACTWFANTKLVFSVDGEEEIVQRQIGEGEYPISFPLVLKKPILVENQIVWTAINDDNDSHVFGVLCDGSLYEKKKKKTLEHLGR